MQPEPNNFDGLRLLGAFMVLGSHQFALVGWPEPVAIGPYTFGTIGVLIFFSISGILVAASWKNDPNLIRFASRRFLRIWPALAVVVIGLAALAYALRPTERPAALAFLKNLVFIRSDDGKFFPTNVYPQLDGSIWTISIEVTCYAIFACIALAAKRWTAVVVLCSAILLFCWLAHFSDAGMRAAALSMGDPTYAVWFGGFFAFGAVLSYWPRLEQFTVVFVVLGVCLLLIGKISIGLLLMLPPIVGRVGKSSWWAIRSAGKFGDLSYGVYLFAWPIQQAVIAIVGRNQSWEVLFTISSIITIAFAYASWHLVERQALKFKPRRPRD